MQSVLRKTAKRSIKAYLLTRLTTWLLLLGVLFLTSLIGIALFVALSLGGDSELDEDFYVPSTDGNAQITKEVLRWEPLIRKYAEKEGITEQVGLLLALVQQESGGRHLDVMQSSESLGLPRGALIDPEYSIQARKIDKIEESAFQGSEVVYRGKIQKIEQGKMIIALSF